MSHGYKKFAVTSATFSGGVVGAQKAIIWVWDQLAAVANNHGIVLADMPPEVAANIMGLVMLAAFWFTREQETAPPPPAARGGRAFDHESKNRKEYGP